MFSKLLIKIDPTLTENDIKGCFSAFDHNNDNKITFAEFSKTLSNAGRK
jgi:Ca2+-binding EF-hand superfamily protein